MKRPGYLKFTYPSIIALAGLIGAPIALPILPVDIFLQYQKALGFQMPKTEVSFDSPLPQHFAGRLSWPEMVRKVAQVYNSLPPGDKARAAVYASNFGQVGAIDFWGPKYGLPKAICPHQKYFRWGPRQYTGEIMIVLGSRREQLEGLFDSIEDAGTVNYPYTMSYEHYTICICRGLKMPLSELWPQLKFWN